jgi:hypothetical protein
MRVHPSCGAALRIENLRGIVSPETSSGRSLVLPCPQLSWLHTRAVGPRRMSVMIRFDPSTTPRRNGRYLRIPAGWNRREADIHSRRQATTNEALPEGNPPDAVGRTTRPRQPTMRRWLKVYCFLPHNRTTVSQTTTPSRLTMS